MKFTKFLPATLPLLLSLGCIDSHRAAPVVYTPPPATTTVVSPSYTPPPPTTTVVVPTSDRPFVRVYPGISAGDTAPGATAAPAQVLPTSSDVAMADTIRRMFDADPSFSNRCRSAEVGVYNGTVTLRGTVLSRSDSDELQRRIATLPGVARIDNQLQTSLP